MMITRVGGRTLVGMVHLLPLPGAPGWQGSLHQVIDRALQDANALASAGFDALMIENFGDAPFFPEQVPPETIAAMAVVGGAIASQHDLPIGINVLRNDAAAALAIASVLEAAFIRVNVHTGALLTDQGWISGRAHETLRRRAALRTRAPKGGGVAICADVLVKHAIHPAGVDVEQIARETYERGRADVLIVTGVATGGPTDPERIARVKRALPQAPVWVGSGLTAASAGELLRVADGAIVGSALKADGNPMNPIDPDRTKRLVEAARS